MSHFMPVQATVGGLLIGGAAVLLWLGNGRIAGISGIIGGLLAPVRGDIFWRAAFLAGLVLGPLLYAAMTGRPPPVQQHTMPLQMAAGGALVGFGTILGGGCTSGHGVCGLARARPRSAVATGLFMACAVATVFVIRHVAAG